MAKSILKPTLLVTVILGAMYVYIKKQYFHPTKKFDLTIDDYGSHTQLPQGHGLTRVHALHFYEVFLDILLNKHNRFAEHAENVQLLNYLLRNDNKWRVTETAIFNILDVTGNDYINKKEFESFVDLFPRISDKRLIENFQSVIDRNIDTKIMKYEWFNFCNKNLRPKLLQDLQEWEETHQIPLPNPKKIHAQFTALDKKDRNHRDLIHGQLDRALDMVSEDFMMFINHWENKTPHTIDDPDMFVRRLGYWILNRFERWDATFMWIYQILDDDGDGQLLPKEVAQQFKVFEVPLVHVQEIFEYLDENGNGIIERDEWKSWSETIRKLLVLYFKEIEPKMEDYQ